MTTQRRAVTVWLTGLAAYTVAVLNRTSLGVSGLDATERFGASASVLASFAVLQLLVYAALQIPVGVLVDQLGPRRLVVAGALLMAAGQLVLALADSVGLAILARVLVGAGDALTFISVLRLVAAWFPPARVPVITQLTGITGQLGQVLSAVRWWRCCAAPAGPRPLPPQRRSASSSGCWRWSCCAMRRRARPRVPGVPLSVSCASIW